MRERYDVNQSITFSAMANTVASGATEKVNGMTLASTTRRLAVRWTLKSGATTPAQHTSDDASVRRRQETCFYSPRKYSGARAAVPMGWKVDYGGAG